MKKFYLIITLLMLQGSFLFAQIAINADGSAPDASAGLDISYSNKGLLIPRLTFEQRNSIQNPAQGLIVYCSNCNPDGKGALSIYEGTGWKTMELRCDAPNVPSAGNLVSSTNQITWNWVAVPAALGYRIGISNDFNAALEVGNLTTYTEYNLNCNTIYTRYVWAYNQCGQSVPMIVQKATEQIPMSGSPLEGSHASTLTTVTWNWGTVDGASGYKWSDQNNLIGALDLGTNTTYLETGLECGTAYQRYVWAYNACGYSPVTMISKNTANEAAPAPAEGEHLRDSYTIVWQWQPVPEADGYRWGETNVFEDATDVLLNTSYTETGLACFTPFTRYVWAYNNCGISVAVAISASTTSDVHPAPTPAACYPGSHQVEWNWHPLESHFSNFKWNRTPDFQTATDLQTDTTYLETGLLCNTTYTRYVWGYDQCAVADPIELTATTTLFPPANPQEGAHVPEAFAITWTWTAVPEATGYKWGINNNAAQAQDLGNVTSFIESNLACNQPYTRYIWAYNNCGVSIATALNQVTALNPPPSPDAAGHQSFPEIIIWNWTPVAGATGYKFGLSSNFEEAQEMGNATSKFETSLNCNTNYTRYVWAYNICGVSAAAALVQTTALDPPANPVVGTHVPGPFQVEWKWFAAPDATGYKWSATNDFGQAQDLGNNTSIIETELNCNTNYTRYIWSYSPCGNSGAVSLVQTTSLYPPVPPTAGTHTPSPFQIIWAWNPVSGATGYKWGITNNESQATDIGNVTSYTESGLACNTSFNRYVWAYSPCGISTPVMLTQTTSLNPPAAPTAGTHTSTASQITWNWNTVAGATGYKWNSTNTLTGAQDMLGSTSKTVTGLNCNTAYNSFVWAYSPCGTSTPVQLNFTTSIETPPAPSAGTHVATNTQVVWNWNAVAGATGYRWSTTNDFGSATNLNNVTTYTESGLSCGQNLQRYVWAYNNCANSVSTVLTQSTSTTPPGTPTALTHTPSGNQIIWNWTPVSGATSYRFSTQNDFATATDLGNVTSRTETGLNCNQAYTRYVWAFNGCTASGSLTVNSTTTSNPPATPTSGEHNTTPSQITWTWNPVADATGYKWNTVNIYSSAFDNGNATTRMESNLNCNQTYTRFVWAYNSCGVSTSVPLTGTTGSEMPATPGQGTNIVTPEQITWVWNTVSGAAGYKWNDENDYATAEEMGTATSRVETGLNCGTSYTRYVWAYHSCGVSNPLTMTQTSGACFVCGTAINKSHVAGAVAPVNKTTTYGTVTNVPGETAKCWITSNLGASNQATAVNDATEPSAGWYWQFNRQQGYKHDGTTRTPNTTWVSSIDEYANWVTANDPCYLELGTGWRLPTSTEWSNVDAAGNWSNWNGPWNSLLKMHAAGRIDYITGNLDSRGSKGLYWAGTQSAYTYMGMDLNFQSNSSTVGFHNKSFGHSVRCIRN